MITKITFLTPCGSSAAQEDSTSCLIVDLRMQTYKSCIHNIHQNGKVNYTPVCVCEHTVYRYGGHSNDTAQKHTYARLRWHKSQKLKIINATCVKHMQRFNVVSVGFLQIIHFTCTQSCILVIVHCNMHWWCIPSATRIKTSATKARCMLLPGSCKPLPVPQSYTQLAQLV